MIHYPLSLVYDWTPKTIHVDPETGLSTEVLANPYGGSGTLFIDAVTSADGTTDSPRTLPIEYTKWNNFDVGDFPNRLSAFTVEGEPSYTDLFRSYVTPEEYYGISVALSNWFLGSRPVGYNLSLVYTPTIPVDREGALCYLSSSPFPSATEAKFRKRSYETMSLYSWLIRETGLDFNNPPDWLDWFSTVKVERERRYEPNHLNILSAASVGEDFSYVNVAHEKMNFTVVFECESTLNPSKITLANPVGNVYYDSYNWVSQDGEETLLYKWWTWQNTTWGWTTTTGKALPTNPPLSSRTVVKDHDCFYNNLDCKANLPMHFLEVPRSNQWPTSRAISAALSSNQPAPFGGWDAFRFAGGVDISPLFPGNVKFEAYAPLRRDGLSTESGLVDNEAGEGEVILTQEPAPLMRYETSLKDIVRGGYLLYPYREDNTANHYRSIPLMGLKWLYTGDGTHVNVNYDGTIQGTQYYTLDVDVSNEYADVRYYKSKFDTGYGEVEITTGIDIPATHAGIHFLLNDIAKTLQEGYWGLVLFLSPVWIPSIPSDALTDMWTCYYTGPGNQYMRPSPGGFRGPSNVNHLPIVPVLFRSTVKRRRLPSIAEIAKHNPLAPVEKLEFVYDSCPTEFVGDVIVEHLNEWIPYFGARAVGPHYEMINVAKTIGRNLKFTVHIEYPQFAGSRQTNHIPLRRNKARFTGDYFSTLSASSYSRPPEEEV